MTADIRLRRYQIEDIDPVFEAVMESRAELIPWMPWCHPEYSRADAAIWVEGRAGAWERNEEWSFVIVDSQDRILGGCGIHRLDLRNGVGELGYWVRTSATRQGIATETTRQMCNWAFREAGLHRVEIVMSIENVGSQRVAEKSGGHREGILRERILLQGRWHDGVLFSILPD